MKRLIYHNSLTAKYTICPYCKAENTDILKGWAITLNGQDEEFYKKRR